MKWHLLKEREQRAKLKAWAEKGITPRCPYCGRSLTEIQVDGKTRIGCSEHGVNFHKKRMRRN